MVECLNTNRLKAIATKIYLISARSYITKDIGFSKFSHKKYRIYYYSPKKTFKTIKNGNTIAFTNHGVFDIIYSIKNRRNKITPISEFFRKCR